MIDDRSYPDRPIVGIGVVVFKGPRVLLIQRGKPPRQGQWSLPGGVQELGETVHEAARREVAEETGVDIDIVGLIDTVDSIQRDESGRVRYHYTLIDVAATWRAGEPRAGSDAAGVCWAPRADLGAYDLWRETTRIIGLAEALVGKR